MLDENLIIMIGNKSRTVWMHAAKVWVLHCS